MDGRSPAVRCVMNGGTARSWSETLGELLGHTAGVTGVPDRLLHHGQVLKWGP